MKQLQVFIATLVLSGALFCAKAQDAHFSLINLTPTVYNPAFAGMSQGDQRVSLHQRSQWGSVGTPYNTFALLGDLKVLRNKKKTGIFGAGINLIRDRAGDVPLRTTDVELNLAYHLRTDANGFFGLGLNLGLRGTNLDLNGAQWDSQFNGTGFDPSLASGEPQNFNTANQFSLGGGVVYSHQEGGHRGYLDMDKNHFSFGASVVHINRPSVDFYPLISTHQFTAFNAHFEGNFLTEKGDFSIVPSALVQWQGVHLNAMFGGHIRYLLNPQSQRSGLIRGNAVSAGIHHRWGDSIIPSVMAEVGAWSLMLGYDILISDLTETAGGRGGLELGIRLTNPNPLGGRKPN
jgi:type IX secretion system PorP/SprF family membrane protein